MRIPSFVVPAPQPTRFRVRPEGRGACGVESAIG